MKKCYAALLMITAVMIPACSETDQRLASFQIHPDFQIELVASEPVVVDPVDLKFDEHGRAFVVEMPSYPFPVEESRVVLLEDENGDGVYDKRTVFAEGLGMGTTTMPYRGGLLVTTPPDLLFMKDTDGDNVADVREVLLSGFAVENPQHNYNGMMIGPDNWIYAANGGNSGKVYWPDRKEEAVPIRGDDFRFHLDNKTFERIGESAGGYGITMNDWGHIFTTHNLDHISNLVFHGRYINNLPVTPAHTLKNISAHNDGELARIYPIGVQETRVNHPEQSGYFSGGCGITYYGGGAFGEAFNDNVFVCDVVLNLIHRDVLQPNGSTFDADRGREGVEFLASSDRAFRPVYMKTGPDGALYVLDMHREVIEHPEWIPDEIEENLDVESGKDKGRIYRITPKSGLAWEAPVFEKNNLMDVVQKLADPNKWQRDTAQRLLLEWEAAAAENALRNLFKTSDSPQGRLHSLWTLHGLGLMDAALVTAGLADKNPGVRENALIIAEEFIPKDPSVMNAVLKMAKDGNPRVRLQTALTLSVQDQSDANTVSALAGIAKQDADDPYTRMALVSASGDNPLPFLGTLLGEKKLAASKGGQELLNSLAKVIGKNEGETHIAAVVSALYETPGAADQTVAAVLDGLAEGVESRESKVRRNQSLDQKLTGIEARDEVRVVRASLRLRQSCGLNPTPRQRQMLKEIAGSVEDPAIPTAQRLDYLDMLAFADFKDREDVLYRLVGTQQPNDIQVAAMYQLAYSGNPEVPKKLIAIWKNVGPQARAKAIDFLVYRPSNHNVLLTALENGELTVGELYLHLERRRAMLFSDDPEIRRRAEALFSDGGVVTRREAIENMRPALSLTGKADAGEAVFKELCAKCHQVGSLGESVGPDLTEIYRKSPETLLYEILDPNAAIEQQYISYTVKTTGGELINGIVARETDTEVTILNANSVSHTIPRSQIKEMYSGGISLMPEELESGMTHQTMADLLAFLQRTQ